jgi:membrane protein involved in colicin uptake
MQLDPKDRRSYEQRNFFEREANPRVDGFTIFIAVLSAILVSWLIFYLYLQWEVRQAEEMARKQLEHFTLQIQAETQRSKAQMEARRRHAEEQAILRAEENRRIAEDAHRAEEARRAERLAAIQANITKQKAWEEFYKPIEGCEASNLNRDTLKCGNDHARAKKKFEDMWASPSKRSYP